MQDNPEPQTNVALADYTTMSIGGPAELLMVARHQRDVEWAAKLSDERNLPLFVLGEGSNLIVSDRPLRRLVLKMEIPGYEIVHEDEAGATLRLGAGEHWDGVVERAVTAGWAGIESMSMIPGTVGAAPVQNAGAYGQEMADTLVRLEAYDLEQKKFVSLERADCGFGYRTSRFKADWAGRFVIVNVTLRLRKGAPAVPTYASLRRYLDEHGLTHPTVAQIREAVMAIRARVLPDPSVVPNAGSFFKNPMVDDLELARLRSAYPQLVSYPYEGQYKLAAGWLLEQCGFKGAEHFGLKLWANHALVITNPHGAGYDDLMKLVELMVRAVRERFGVTLEPEPLIIT